MPEEDQSPQGHNNKPVATGIHDYEVEYRYRNISREDAQALLYDLPDTEGDLYIKERAYNEERRTLTFTVYLDDVSPVNVSAFMDFMESTYPDCKLQYSYMYDYTQACDEETIGYVKENLSLSQYEGNRTLPPQ